jgi:putative ABC transport system ATP-binding protein
MTKSILVDGLTASYGMGNVLTEVSFQVDKGEFVGIYGRSGCGKSTLLHVLGGLHRPLEGRVVVSGLEVSSSSDDELLTLRRNHVSFVFQQSFLISEMTLRENVLFPLLLQNRSRMERNDLADNILKRLDLFDRRDHLPVELSGGQRQRGAIARSLVTCPDVLLVDEPTGALDEESGKQVLRAISELAHEQGATVLMVSHDDLALSYADRLIHLVDGRIPSSELTQDQVTSWNA